MNSDSSPLQNPIDSSKVVAVEPPAESKATGAPLSAPLPTEPSNGQVEQLVQQVADLERRKRVLQQEITALQERQTKMLQTQIAETQATLGRLIQEGLAELEQRRQALQITVEQLERRQERIRTEMRSSFAGASQDLAIRVQGFKDYLVGSLQDLVTSAEQLPLLPQTKPQPEQPVVADTQSKSVPAPKFAEQAFQDQAKQIRTLLDRYRTSPDYYGPPWQLRRTFEPIHAERVSNWFFTQGGRGALRSMGSRLQNILVASAVISVLDSIHGDDLRTLILANTPERLGEWRRGLQDCLGITRGDFGPEQGIVLFEAPDPLIQKADRLIKQKELPLIIIDDSEEQISLALLQFPLWLAFASDPQMPKAL
ncbi:MAG: DUF3086 domain-containing protein [Leptolyngbyaceae bacterium]|nr:DUF3086 domain-containing protein [Leptolyngbyaceae bacterium]